jgi:hypothetical protein
VQRVRDLDPGALDALELRGRVRHLKGEEQAAAASKTTWKRSRQPTSW